MIKKIHSYKMLQYNIPCSVDKFHIKKAAVTVDKFKVIINIGFKKYPLLPTKFPIMDAIRPIQLESIIKNN